MTLLDCLGEDCPEGFEQLEVVYENSWSDYEECGSVVVFDFFGELFVDECGYCVMAENNNYVFDPQPITVEELEHLKKEWNEIIEAMQ